MRVIVPFSYCLALSLGMFRGRRGGSRAGAGNLAVFPPAAVVPPAVAVVFPVRASPFHRPVPPALLLPPEALFPILYLQAAPLLPGQPIYMASAWARRRHTLERDAAANGVRLIFLDPFDVGVHTVQSRCLPSTCFSWSAMVTTSGAPNTASSTTSSIDSSLVRFLAFPLFLSRGPIAVIPCHAESTLHPTAGNRLKMHHYAHGSHAKMLINYTAPFIYTLPDPDKVL